MCFDEGYITTNFNKMTEQCALCYSTRVLFKCNRCCVTSYCSRAHKETHYQIHKKECFPIIEKTCDELGRHLVASKDLRAGDLIIKESPLAFGVSSDDPRANICFTCGKDLANGKKCPRCRWPICGRECKMNAIHLPICTLTIKNFLGRRPRVPKNLIFYSYLFAIQCLYNRSSNPEVYEKLKKMQTYSDHVGYEDRMAYRNLQKIFHLQDYSFEDILHLTRIIRTNKLFTNPLHKYAIYDKSSLLSHSCFPNAFVCYNDKEDIVIKASVRIKRNDNISISYLPPVLDYMTRRGLIKDKHDFYCTCRRCEDPTDMHTHTNSILCQFCLFGMVSPPIGREHWKCHSCGKVADTEKTTRLLEGYYGILPDVENAEDNKFFLLGTKKKLSNNHWIRMIAKKSILTPWDEDDFKPNVGIADVIDRKINDAESLLKFHDRIIKGFHPEKVKFHQIIYKCLAWKLKYLTELETDETKRIRIKKKIQKHIRYLLKTLIFDSIAVDEQEMVIEANQYSKQLATERENERKLVFRHFIR